MELFYEKSKVLSWDFEDDFVEELDDDLTLDDDRTVLELPETWSFRVDFLIMSSVSVESTLSDVMDVVFLFLRSDE